MTNYRTMKDNITAIAIGDELFYGNLAEYAMVDQTMQLEARITKVKIQWIFEFENESNKYLFMIGNAKLQSEWKQLFKTEEEAKTYIQTKIDAIPVLVDLQEPVSDITKEVEEADKEWTAFGPQEEWNKANA